MLQWKWHTATCLAEKDAKWSHNFYNEHHFLQQIRIRARTFAIVAAVVAVAVVIVVSCWKPARAREAVREPRGLHIVRCLHLGGTFFLNHCLKHFFLQKLRFSKKIVAEMDPKWTLLGAFFSKRDKHRKVCFDCAGVYGLHISPHRGAPGPTHNYIKNRLIPETTFSRNM